MGVKSHLNRVLSSPPSLVTRPSITRDDDDDDGLLLLEVVIGGNCNDEVAAACSLASGVPDMMSPSVPDPTISSISSSLELMPSLVLLPFVAVGFSSSPFDRIDDMDSSE